MVSYSMDLLRSMSMATGVLSFPIFHRYHCDTGMTDIITPPSSSHFLTLLGHISTPCCFLITGVAHYIPSSLDLVFVQPYLVLSFSGLTHFGTGEILGNQQRNQETGVIIVSCNTPV